MAAVPTARVLIGLASCLLLAGCSSEVDDAAEALKQYAAALARSDAEACERVWYGKINPARCSEMRTWIAANAPDLAGGKLEVESARVYGHGASVEMEVRVAGASGTRRLHVDMLHSCDEREHRPGPRCPYWVHSIADAPPAAEPAASPE